MADLTAQINSIIEAQRGFANDAVSAAMAAASRANGGFIPNGINASLAFTNSTPLATNPAAAPTFTARYLAPTNNATLANLETLYVPTVPTFADAPTPIDTSTMFLQPVPVFDLNPFTETAPVVSTEIAVPDAPELNLPAAPETYKVTMPDRPDITIPDFTPINTDATDPGVLGNVVLKAEQVYNNSRPEMRAWLDGVVEGWMQEYAPDYAPAMAKLEAKISAGIDGGTAMSDAIEQQIFDRARDKAEAERERSEVELLEGMASRGYSLPPSAVSAGLVQIQQATAKNVAMAAAETAIARAKLEQEHAQFIMNLSSTMHMGLLGVAIQYAGQLVQINGQSLQYSQQLASSMVEEYNARLARYTAELQLAGIQTQIYEAQMKAAMADLTIYEVEMRGAELEKNMEKLNVEVFATLIKAEATKIDNYVAQLQGVTAEANLRKLSVEIYGEQVRAYVAQVGAKKAEFDVYTAAISGDEAKIRAYATQVNAFTQEVNAAKAEADIEIAHSRAVADHNKNLIEEFKAELAAFGAELDAARQSFGAESDAYKAVMEGYKVQQALKLEVLNSLYKHSALDLDAAKASLSATIQAELGVRQVAQSGIAAGGSTAVGVANAMASLAGSAAGATNTIVNMAQESTG